MTDFPDFDLESEDLQKEVIEHNPAATERSSARRIALQALYEIDSADHNIGDVITSLLEENPVNRKISNYLRRLVNGVRENRTRLDAVIQQYAPEWPLEQVAIIDRNILRLAVYEMVAQARMPVGVAIDEAVELAKLFGSESTPRFVNGVLGALVENIDSIRQLFAEDEGTTS